MLLFIEKNGFLFPKIKTKHRVNESQTRCPKHTDDGTTTKLQRAANKQALKTTNKDDLKQTAYTNNKQMTRGGVKIHEFI